MDLQDDNAVGRTLLGGEQLGTKQNADEVESKTNFRYAVLAISTLCCSLIISSSFAFNFSLICAPVNSHEFNQSLSSNPATEVPPEMQRLIYSAYSLSNLLTLPLVTPLLKQFSMRFIVFAGGIITVICTAATPFLLTVDYRLVVVIRFLQGLGNTPLFPLIGFVCTHWCPKQQTALFVSVLTSYSQIGIFITMGASGLLCSFDDGWRYIFYFHSLICAVAFTMWLIMFRDFPQQHPWVNQAEVSTISTEPRPAEHLPVPYREVFKDRPFWAVVVAGLGNFNGISPLIVFSAQILSIALRVSAFATGLLNSFSFLLQLFFKLFAGVVSDKWGASELFKLRFFNCISCGLCGVMMLTMAAVSELHQVLCVCLVILTQGFIGFNAGGFNKAAVIIARQHSHFPMTMIGVGLCTGLILEPFLVCAVARDHLWHQWKILFILHGIILISTNAFFCIFVRAEPSSFTNFCAPRSGSVKEGKGSEKLLAS